MYLVAEADAGIQSLFFSDEYALVESPKPLRGSATRLFEA